MSKIISDKSDYKIDVTLITCGVKTIYTNAAKADKIAERMEKKVEDIYEDIIGEELEKKYLEISVGGSTQDGDEISMPKIKYIFKTK